MKRVCNGKRKKKREKKTQQMHLVRVTQDLLYNSKKKSDSTMSQQRL